MLKGTKNIIHQGLEGGWGIS